jgi:hypothetical protein
LGLANLQELPLTVVDLVYTSVSTTGILQLLYHSQQLNSICLTNFHGDRIQVRQFLEGFAFGDLVDLTS